LLSPAARVALSLLSRCFDDCLLDILYSGNIFYFISFNITSCNEILGLAQFNYCNLFIKKFYCKRLLLFIKRINVQKDNLIIYRINNM
jgi:hypothetical protein